MRKDRLRRNARSLLVLLLAAGLHAYLLLSFAVRTEAPEEREDVTIFRMVDVQEYVPPPPEPEPEPEPPEPEEIEEVPEEEIAEEVIETEQEIEEEDEPPPPPVESPPPDTEAAPAPPEIEYLPQHMISAAPQIPMEAVRANIEYPTLANRQGIEGVVYLELYIDADGEIREIQILRDPGYGLGQAAVEAFDGIRVVPAEANGTPVAVKFRFPVRFQLK